MKKLKIGICGWGNVATGLYKTLEDNRIQIESNSNTQIDIVAVSYTHLRAHET